MILVRVALPSHLRALAGVGVGAEVRLEVPDAPTLADAIDALEAAHPALCGTIRDRATGARRPYMRYVAGGRDLSHEPPGHLLPTSVVAGSEALRLIGAIAGG